jgi:RimJ/RimL family protein N-acetyltransferase
VIETRFIGPDDWRVWRELRLAALADAPAAFSSTLAEWTGAGDVERRWRARLADVPLNLVVHDGGVPAGMVSGTAPDADGHVHLISMWAAPSFRGHGVGDEAVRQVVAWAAAEHPTSPLVLSVKAGNRHAIALYERHGFVDAGPSPDDPGERLMQRAAPRGPLGSVRW